MMADEISTTWSAHVRLLCMKYGLPDPLQLLKSETVWPKARWMTLVKTRITIYFEQDRRAKAIVNSKMQYLNVQLQGLCGAPHTALLNIRTVQDALKLRFHLKFLTGNYLTRERLAINQGTNPRCRLCPAPAESNQHNLTQCPGTADIHRRMLPELLNIVQPSSMILADQSTHLTQFILDCTSINLPDSYRIPAHSPSVLKCLGSHLTGPMQLAEKDPDYLDPVNSKEIM